MKTLIIAPHMDDESISCGGLIARRAYVGDMVFVLAVCGRFYGSCSEREQAASDAQEYRDFESACKTLGVHGQKALMLGEGEPAEIGFYGALEPIESALRDWDPDEVVIPGADDLNQDHRHLNYVCKIALRPINLRSVRRVLEFHALDGRARAPTYYVSLTKSVLDLKRGAINCYIRERRELPSPRAPDNVEAQARVWGAACGVEFAEGYTMHLTRE